MIHKGALLFGAEKRRESAPCLNKFLLIKATLVPTSLEPLQPTLLMMVKLTSSFPFFSSVVSLQDISALMSVMQQADLKIGKAKICHHLHTYSGA